MRMRVPVLVVPALALIIVVACSSELPHPRYTGHPTSALSEIPFPPSPVRALTGSGSTLRLTPHAHGTDGYFIAALTRAAPR